MVVSSSVSYVLVDILRRFSAVAGPSSPRVGVVTGVHSTSQRLRPCFCFAIPIGSGTSQVRSLGSVGVREKMERLDMLKSQEESPGTR